MSAGQPLRVAVENGCLTLTLNRPEKRNALDSMLVEAFHEALDRAELDAEVRVVVLRGEGKDFCAGADLDELSASADRPAAENEASALRLGAVFRRMRELPKPVVGMVRGRALAGGMGLVTACDIVLAGAGAQFGYPEIQRGFVPAMVLALLCRACGKKAALDLVLTGRLVSAAEAQALGLIARVATETELEQETAAVVAALTAASPSALALTKKLFYELEDRSVAEGLALGARVNALARETPEFREGVARFLRR